MARPKLTVYLDIISPFAYMAFHITKNSPLFAQADVTYLPIFLGGVMQACNNSPPLNIRNKGPWLTRERQRWSTRFNIPIAAESPQPFPQPTLNTMRAVCALALVPGAQARLDDVFAALFQALWVRGETIGKVEVFGPVLRDVLGEEMAAEVLRKATSPEAKSLLKSNTDRALASGAFGLPWFEATNSHGVVETFWGVDHLGQVVEHLGLQRRDGGEGFRALL